MNKFSLIETFTKLAEDKNALNTLTSLVGGIVNGNKNANANKSAPTKIPERKYSQEAILSLLKKHEEMSKKIDLSVKNIPPEK